VATWFLPKRLRQHFFNVYAYCRIADDLGDEVGDPEASLALLDEWEAELDRCYDGTPGHPVFVALAETVRQFEIPKHEFSDLVKAFRQDQTVTRYETFDDFLQYCANSANPVGHLVLYLGGYRDAERHRLSDFTCTALQLTNSWQDVTQDFEKGRVYLPQEDLARDVELFSRGGMEILDAIAASGYDVLSHRPTLSQRRKLVLVARAAWSRMV
jgi:squalene synthase HpnC